MIMTAYKCDRCSRVQNTTKMKKFECQFGRPLSHQFPLPNLNTGHLCPKCEAEWCNLFFNPIQNFIKNVEVTR